MSRPVRSVMTCATFAVAPELFFTVEVVRQADDTVLAVVNGLTHDGVAPVLRSLRGLFGCPRLGSRVGTPGDFPGDFPLVIRTKSTHRRVR